MGCRGTPVLGGVRRGGASPEDSFGRAGWLPGRFQQGQPSARVCSPAAQAELHHPPTPTTSVLKSQPSSRS